MKKLFLYAIAFAFIQTSFAQYVWTQKTSPPVVSGHYDAASFSIQGKIYMAGGCNNLLVSNFNDLWEYDPVNDSWAQKANMPGSGTYGSSTFVINDEGFVVTGWYRSSGSPYPAIFNQKYNPTTNLWVPITPFPLTGRYTGISFAINGKGYFGTGYAPLTDDFWEYNPIAATWTQKANVPGGLRQAALGFAVGNFGYAGIGGQYSSQQTDWHQYNPLTNTWTAKATYPGAGRSAVSAFHINNDVYIVGGSNYNSTPFQDVYKYNATNDAWSYVGIFPGGPRFCMSEGQANGRGYVGQGCYTTQASGIYSTQNDWWEYGPLTGVNEAFQKNNLSLYPNPVKDLLYVNLSTQKNTIKNVFVFDNRGQIVFEKNNVADNFEINTNGFSNGNYILQIVTEGYSISKTFVK